MGKPNYIYVIFIILKNSKGKLIPQAEFDQNPVLFFEENIDKNEMEYLGISEDIKFRKGEKKYDYHKILVKSPLINRVVSEYVEKNQNYVPISLSYLLKHIILLSI